MKRADAYLKRGFGVFCFHCCSQLLFLVGLDKSTLSLVSSLICKERAKYILFSLTRRFYMILGPSCLAVSLAWLVLGILRDGLTQPGMTLFEKRLLHEVSGTSDSLLSKEHHESRFSLRPGKHKLQCEPASPCGCDRVRLCACRGATPSKLPELKFALGVWRSLIENCPCNLTCSAERCTLCKASVLVWTSR